MPRLIPRGEHADMRLHLPSNCEIIFDRHIFDYMLHELHRYPTSEEGGKYIGYLDVSNPHRSKDRDCRVMITDFLPGGPNATRTAVEFLPDGDFQEQLFRQAEKRDSNVEHLGSWHSHHCNGLDRLSGGDIEGYFKTVNKAAYRPDVFVASLVKHLPRSPRDMNWIDHFLFVRSDDRFYKITNHVTIADSRTRFADITGHSLINEQPEALTSKHRERESSATAWHETEVGRKTLAEDKRFFAERFGQNLRATRTEGIITIRCGTGLKFIAVSYPAAVDDREIEVNVGSASQTILKIRCDYSHRNVAYTASLNALEYL
jgi:hypothetical protein